MQRVLSQRFQRTFRQVNVQDSWHRSKGTVAHHDWIQLQVLNDTRTTGSSLHTKGIHRVDRGTYIDSALREIYGVYKAARSASSNRDRGLAVPVLKDTAITKRQPDLATRMVLEQDSLLSSGNDEQPTILDFVDHAAESITASVSVRD